MSKTLTKILAFGAVALTTVVGALVGYFIPDAALAVAVGAAIAVAAAGAAVDAVTVVAFTAVAAGAFGVTFAGMAIVLANIVIEDYYARKVN